jgi:hypothetical protein
VSRAEEHGTCRCLTMAENEVGAVSLCPQCGVVTMRLQYISLRFETEAFERVGSLVEQARARIHRMRPFDAAYREINEPADRHDDIGVSKPH